MNRYSLRLSLLVAALVGLAACSSVSEAATPTDSVPSSTTMAEVQSDDRQLIAADPASDPAGMKLVSAFGNDIVLNRLWVQGCIPGANGIDWNYSQRVLLTETEPFILVQELIDYQNGSATPDCSNGRVGSSSITQEVAALGVEVPFTWVDAAGNPAQAPKGLGETATGSGVEGTLTEANVTPETPERVEELNAAAFCGASDWVVGEPKDTFDCFTNGGETASGKLVLVVDDSAVPWKNYQALATGTYDDNGFANQVPNVMQFDGPFVP